MRLTFRHCRRFAAIKNESSAIYGSIRADLIRSLFHKKSAFAAFGPYRRLVKVMDETEASATTQLSGQNQERQSSSAHQDGRARTLAGALLGASAVTGGAR